MELTKVLKRLDSFVVDETNSYAVQYKGKRIKMPSGKSVWATIGAAKNAVRVAVGHSVARDAGFSGTPELFKYLEDTKLIEYVKMKS